VLNPTLTYAEFESSPEGVGEDAQGTPTAIGPGSSDGSNTSATASGSVQKSEVSKFGVRFSFIITVLAAIYFMIVI
jgi:hypothetical protein